MFAGHIKIRHKFIPIPNFFIKKVCLIDRSIYLFLVHPSFNLYLGAVVCNLEGLVLAQVEALAARRAIELPIELGFIRIILEGEFFLLSSQLSAAIIHHWPHLVT